VEGRHAHARAVNSSFTYATAREHLLPLERLAAVLPHPNGGDSVAIPVRRTSEAWSSYVPFDSLPQMLNPTGGYIHNENDAPYFTNMRAPLDFTKFRPTSRRRAWASQPARD
jgi:acyl-homoserine-lactone acylase